MSPDLLETALTLAAMAVAIGLSLYAALAVPGILAYLGLIELPVPISGLAVPLVWSTLIALALVDLACGRYRIGDLVWTALHTLARPLAAALLASAVLAAGPRDIQWFGALAALGLAALVHVSVMAVRTARRTAGPVPALHGLTAIQILTAAGLAGLAWTAPPFAASIAAVLVLAPLPWTPRLWGAAFLLLSAIYAALTRAGRFHRWESPDALRGATRRLIERELGDSIGAARSARVTLARLGPGWPYLRGRLVVASERMPLFAHKRGFRTRLIPLGRASGDADHGAIVETVEVEAAAPYALCLGPDSPSGPAILAALRDSD